MILSPTVHVLSRPGPSHGYADEAVRGRDPAVADALDLSAIRAGALTTRGFTEAACRQVVDLIADVVDAGRDDAVVAG